VDHLSDWHMFTPKDRTTYPKVNAPVQVRFDDGELKEGYTLVFFPQSKLLPGSSIIGWRYIKGLSQR
jgi:hypothetical protein